MEHLGSAPGRAGWTSGTSTIADVLTETAGTLPRRVAHRHRCRRFNSVTLSKSVAKFTAGLEFNTSQLEALLTITSGSIDADIGDSNNIAWTFDGIECLRYLADGEKLVLTYNIATDTTNKTDSQDELFHHWN